MSNITLDSASITISIDTVHKHLLEFVLRAAEGRAWERDQTSIFFYSDILTSMLTELFSVNDDVWLGESTSTLYGNLSFDICGSSYQEVVDTLDKVDEVVQMWKVRYNVDRMKTT